MAHEAHGVPTLTPNQLNSGVTTSLVMAVIFALISFGLWLFIAKASRERQWSAPTVGSGLLAVDTVIMLIGPPTWGPVGLGLFGQQRPSSSSSG